MRDTIQTPQVSSPLSAAVAQFNLVLGEPMGVHMDLPILPELVELAAEFSALRGRQDIADDLRLALKETLQNLD